VEPSDSTKPPFSTIVGKLIGKLLGATLVSFLAATYLGFFTAVIVWGYKIGYATMGRFLLD